MVAGRKPRFVGRESVFTAMVGGGACETIRFIDSGNSNGCTSTGASSRHVAIRCCYAGGRTNACANKLIVFIFVIIFIVIYTVGIEVKQLTIIVLKM